LTGSDFVAPRLPARDARFKRYDSTISTES
jgi:hypothetical protein